MAVPVMLSPAAADGKPGWRIQGNDLGAQKQENDSHHSLLAYNHQGNKVCCSAAGYEEAQGTQWETQETARSGHIPNAAPPAL